MISMILFFVYGVSVFLDKSGVLVGILSSQKYLFRHALERKKDGMAFLYSLMDVFGISN